MRGGTSKGAYFLMDDLPQDIELDRFLLQVMGSPDQRQIDGIGGGSMLTSKVALISPSKREGVDLDYKFVQVYVDKPLIDANPTCGNILTAVGCFGIETGLVPAQNGETTVTVFDVNTGFTVKQLIQTPNKQVTYTGNHSIDGVPGTAAPIAMSFINIVGVKTGKLFPTGNKTDIIDGMSVSCIDVAMPTVFFCAEELGVSGYESKAELDAKDGLIDKLLLLRAKAGVMMGMGDVGEGVIPKVAIVAPPQNKGSISGRYFTPFQCHDAFAVSASFAAATGSAILGTILSERAEGMQMESKEEQLFRLEHPAGKMDIGITFIAPDDVVATVVRTSRLIMRGEVAISDNKKISA